MAVHARFLARSTSYNPVSVLMMPVRNFHPSSSKSITIYGQYSNYWSSGYDDLPCGHTHQDLMEHIVLVLVLGTY